MTIINSLARDLCGTLPPGTQWRQSNTGPSLPSPRRTRKNVKREDQCAALPQSPFQETQITEGPPYLAAPSARTKGWCACASSPFSLMSSFSSVLLFVFSSTSFPVHLFSPSCLTVHLSNSSQTSPSFLSHSVPSPLATPLRVLPSLCLVSICLLLSVL